MALASRVIWGERARQPESVLFFSGHAGLSDARLYTAQHLIRVAGKVRHVNRLKSKPAVTAALVRGGCLNDSSSVRQEVDRLVQLPARGGFGLIHPAGIGAAARDEPE